MIAKPFVLFAVLTCAGAVRAQEAPVTGDDAWRGGIERALDEQEAAIGRQKEERARLSAQQTELQRRVPPDGASADIAPRLPGQDSFETQWSFQVTGGRVLMTVSRGFAGTGREIHMKRPSVTYDTWQPISTIYLTKDGFSADRSAAWLTGDEFDARLAPYRDADGAFDMARLVADPRAVALIDSLERPYLDYRRGLDELRGSLALAGVELVCGAGQAVSERGVRSFENCYGSFEAPDANANDGKHWVSIKSTVYTDTWTGPVAVTASRWRKGPQSYDGTDMTQVTLAEADSIVDLKARTNGFRDLPAILRGEPFTP